MHYRNGREAKNGDRIVSLSYEGGHIQHVGTLRDARPGNDYCNGYIQLGNSPSTNDDPIACMCDCLHADDLAELLVSRGWHKRPDGL